MSQARCRCRSPGVPEVVGSWTCTKCNGVAKVPSDAVPGTRWIMLAPMIIVVLAVIAGGALLNRVDIARREAKAAHNEVGDAVYRSQDAINHLREVLQTQHFHGQYLEEARQQLDTCRRRTEYLRDLIELLDRNGELPKKSAWPAWRGVGVPP